MIFNIKSVRLQYSACPHNTPSSPAVTCKCQIPCLPESSCAAEKSHFPPHPKITKIQTVSTDLSLTVCITVHLTILFIKICGNHVTYLDLHPATFYREIESLHHWETENQPKAGCYSALDAEAVSLREKTKQKKEREKWI